MPIFTAGDINNTTILRRSAFFAGVSPAHLDVLAGLGRIETYEAGAPVYRLGEAARIFYVIAAGTVSFSIGTPAPSSRTSQMLRTGDVFGWAALTAQSPWRIATATCVTGSTLLALDGDSLGLLMEQDHQLGFLLMKKLNNLITGNLTAFAAG